MDAGAVLLPHSSSETIAYLFLNVFRRIHTHTLTHAFLTLILWNLLLYNKKKEHYSMTTGNLFLPNEVSVANLYYSQLLIIKLSLFSNI